MSSHDSLDTLNGHVTAGGSQIGELELQTRLLEPVYQAARLTCVWGFRLGAALLACGVVVALAKGEPLGRQADPFGEVLDEIRAGHAAGIIDLAILWFMFTPVATVIIVAASFWRLGDRRYALLSLVVLVILGVSVALALGR
jgi:hypothetical protein